MIIAVSDREEEAAAIREHLQDVRPYRIAFDHIPLGTDADVGDGCRSDRRWIEVEQNDFRCRGNVDR